MRPNATAAVMSLAVTVVVEDALKKHSINANTVQTTEGMIDEVMKRLLDALSLKLAIQLINKPPRRAQAIVPRT